MSKTDVSGLSQLGAKVDLPQSPEEAVLERVPSGNQGKDYLVRFTAPEFTSLCPMTGQPDFAHIVIDYIPDEWLVESKSLKLFLHSFRNHGAFHEDCSLDIAKRLRIEGPTMTRMLDTLEADGLVERLPDPADRRTKQLRVTAEGERVLEEIFAIADELRDRLLDGVPPDRLDELNELLVMLTERLDAGLPE